jgi:hypothetical protein
MSGTTSVPSLSFGAAGFQVPLESAILTGVQADMNAAYGGNMNPSLKTPQGQQASSLTAIIGDANNQMMALFNGVDPALASGRMQDAIGRIYFLTRLPAVSTVLQISCNGLTNVPITVGAQIQDTAGNIYACTQAGTIAASGSVVLSFAAVVAGPTSVPATVKIYQSIPNWNTATVVSGVVGNVVESRADFELRRQNTVAANSMGMNASVLGAVLQVPGVLDAYVTDNSTNSSVTLGGVSLAANSLFVCVAGGASAAIAQAIFTKKGPGCSYTGNTSQTVFDTNAGYTTPFPQYTITYEVPTNEATAINVTLANSTLVPNNALALVQAAAVAAFTGADNNGPKARIGSVLYASRFFGGIAALGSWAQVVSIQIGTQASPTVSFTGSISGTTLTVSAISSGAFAAGQFIYGTGVSGGSIITSQITGSTGGTGTYAMANTPTQTVASEAMVSVTANQNYVTFGIGQLPTFNPLDVNLILAST